MKYYSYNRNGEYVGTGIARPSPLEPNIFLLPALATFVEPPATQNNEVAIFANGRWSTIPDYRGQTAYSSNGQKKVVTDIGELSENWTLTAPPSQWHKLNAENEWVLDTTKKQELITAIRANIDADTDAKILNDFKIEGVGFKLSLENQMNYKAEYELRDVLTYPHKVKSIDGYHQFRDAAEYHLFYLSAVAFIRSTIEAGWDAKDALEGLTTEELIDLL